MFQVAIFIALQPLSIFEVVFTELPYAAATPTATESDQRKSALVVFACSKKCVDAFSVNGPLHGEHSKLQSIDLILTNPKINNIPSGEIQ